MKKASILGLLFLGFALSSMAPAKTRSNVPPPIFIPKPVSHYPLTIPKNCGDGLAKLYDECSDQGKILKQALAKANQEHKTVLVVYGAEWCIWCHVFDRYINGEVKYHPYRWRQEAGELSQWDMQEAATPTDINYAKRLNQYVADNFVVAHIEGDNSNGEKVIAKTGLETDSITGYPFIFALNNQGKFVDELIATDASEVRQSGGKDYRGYRRDLLLNELKKLRAKAQK